MTSLKNDGSQEIRFQGKIIQWESVNTYLEFVQKARVFVLPLIVCELSLRFMLTHLKFLRHLGPKGQKKTLAKGQSLQRELEVSPRSGFYFLVEFKTFIYPLGSLLTGAHILTNVT